MTTVSILNVQEYTGRKPPINAIGVLFIGSYRNPVWSEKLLKLPWYRREAVASKLIPGFSTYHHS
jgi:hypothetical protein